jgi:hypothetical protein
LAKKFKKKEDLKFRDFAYRDERGDLSYKYVWHADRFIKQQYGLQPMYVQFLIYAYDLEFFTIEWMAKQLSKSYNQTKDWLTVKMRKKGLLFDYFSPRDIRIHQDTSMWFRDENRWNYRKRYALTQEGRMIADRWKAIASGREKVELDYHPRAENFEIPDKKEGLPIGGKLKKRIRGHEDTPLGKKLIAKAIENGIDISEILHPSKLQRGE